MAVLFFSFSHKDEDLRDRLEVHLASLKRQNIIQTWHDRRIVAGDEFAGRIGEELERADIILLLISPDFIASDYCFDIEMARALERHEAKEARVIPVILRPCDWHDMPFGKLNATPKDGKAVSTWPNLDEAFLDIVGAIKGVIGHPAAAASTRFATQAGRDAERFSFPRSSNLRIKRKFTDADKDRHLDDAFEYMAKFFELSLNELEQRNSGLQTKFRRIDANTFTALVYQHGKSVSECRISLGGFMGKGITYSSDSGARSNGINDMLNIGSDDQGLYLKTMMNFGSSTHRDDAQLTFEGASEYYWSNFIKRLQQ